MDITDEPDPVPLGHRFDVVLMERVPSAAASDTATTGAWRD